MIEIASENGTLLKVFPNLKEEIIGFHPAFGFVTKNSFQERIQNRERHGFTFTHSHLDFKFSLDTEGSGALKMSALENCQAQSSEKSWILQTPRGKFIVRPVDEKTEIKVSEPTRDNDNLFSILLLLVLLLPLIYMALPGQVEQVAPQIVEPVVVKIAHEVQKPVTVPTSLAQVPQNLKNNDQFKRAIKQDLGFMGLLGRKDLTKALGGAPTQLKDASPGAGAGKAGSGGELLVGLGQGLKHVTVGNSGVAGLGGIGTKGAGGGQGGYGNSQVGSGEGRGLSSIALSQDVILEGGLDQSVVQATIAKYLNQVRACYEQGLKNNPGLGGLVTMAFEINGSGNLNYARVGKSSLGDQGVEQCIGDHMMGWKFPLPRGGVNVKVSYPFLLRSAHS